ncbi:hypothetical protein [Sphingomonas sp.]|uniref:hypothetical protein n=1 Tax=Sphingomonas sp. TaxID=28214 RepID=UPI003B3A98F2
MLAGDIEDMVQWDANDLGEVTLHVPLFAEALPFVLFPADGAQPDVTEKMAATIGDILALSPEHLRQVKDMLWDEANFAFQVADYGVEPEEGETSLEAHLREFGITNPEEAYAKSRIKAIHVADGFSGRFAEVKVATGAENLISVIVRNGRIIDWDNDGTYLGWFDEDEQAAAKKRARVIGA